jgi:cystathionine beta-lyase
MDAKEVHRFLCEDAKLGMNAGFWFGREGAGFTRMNIASPRSVVEEGMDRLVKAFKNRE